MKHGRANNKQIRKLITYVQDDLGSIDGEIVKASKKHIKPREKNIVQHIESIEFLLKAIKSEFKFQKEE